MAIATTAAIPAAQGSHRSGRRSATNANTAAITHTTTSGIGARATCDPRNLPSEACDPCCCERSNAIDPTAAAAPAQAAIRGRAFGAPPKTPSPITATATTSMSSAYNSDFPATPSTVGPDAVGGGAAAVAEPGGAFTPTPNENESVVVWPSSTDTALQLTVYTPSGMSPVIGTTRVLCPCNDGAPVSTGAPELFSRSTSESCASGFSEEFRSSCVGAVSTVDPPAGSEESKSACACATPAMAVNASAASAATTKIRTAPFIATSVRT